MKRFFLLFGFAVLSFGLKAITDSVEVERSRWAVNFSYPSYFGIFLSDAFSKGYVYYPSGISFSLDWKKGSARTWLSPGVTFRTKEIEHDNGTTERISLLEFPIKVKYCLFKNEPGIDPFLTSGISICRIRSKFSRDDQTESLTPRYYLDYLPVLNIGIGSDFRVYKSIALSVDSSFGYNITKVLPNRSSIELKVGFRYKL